MKKSFGFALKLVVLTFVGMNAIIGTAQTPGSLDNTFGTNGRTTTPLTVTATIYDLKVQPDGKTIASGYNFWKCPERRCDSGNDRFRRPF